MRPSKENNKLIRELAKKIRYAPKTGEFFRKVYFGGKGKKNGVAGGASKVGYWKICYKGKSLLAHRLAWFIHFKVLPDVIDHIDGNGLNNRIRNLRVSSSQLNVRNKKRHRMGYLVGTSYNKRLRKWTASYNIGRANRHLGCFSTEKEAHQAYLKAIK